jgi:Xaa-Pro aminopeptidase
MISPDLSLRRARVAEELKLSDGHLLLVGAGEPIPLPEGTDQVYPFRAHTEYFYLTGLECAGGVVAFDPKQGPRDGWVSFVPEVTEKERIWEGKADWPGEPITLLEPWLGTRRGRTIVCLGEPPRGVMPDQSLTTKYRELFSQARRSKDAVELELLRRAAVATAAGFNTVRPLIKAGMSERELQIELEAGFLRGGARRTGYDSIVGTGSNAAVFHFSPSERMTSEGDFLLIDAGAEVDRYVIDVTRTYVVGGKPSPFQRDLHQVVLAAEATAITRCVPGAEWKEIHFKAAIELTAGLVELGVMRGSAESLVDQGAHRLFFPHGIGHLVGLGVRDASGMLPGRLKDTHPSVENLRMDLPLQKGYVTTVEPGIYFVPALLHKAENREKFRDCVNWEIAESHVSLGGVRIEDNVLVTESGPEILTKEIPKEL